MKFLSHGKRIVPLLVAMIAMVTLFGDLHPVAAWVSPLSSLRPFSMTNIWATTVGPRITSRPRDLFLRNETSVPLARFDRSASQQRNADRPCILTIDGIQYNVTAWGKSIMRFV
jgi:hypothetical protein